LLCQRNEGLFCAINVIGYFFYIPDDSCSFFERDVSLSACDCRKMSVRNVVPTSAGNDAVIIINNICATTANETVRGTIIWADDIVHAGSYTGIIAIRVLDSVFFFVCIVPSVRIIQLLILTKNPSADY